MAVVGDVLGDTVGSSVVGSRVGDALGAPVMQIPHVEGQSSRTVVDPGEDGSQSSAYMRGKNFL
jgi:ADP-ribosylglycohydrolase